MNTKVRDISCIGTPREEGVIFSFDGSGGFIIADRDRQEINLYTDDIDRMPAKGFSEGDRVSFRRALYWYGHYIACNVSPVEKEKAQVFKFPIRAASS